MTAAASQTATAVKPILAAVCQSRNRAKESQMEAIDPRQPAYDTQTKRQWDASKSWSAAVANEAYGFATSFWIW